VASFGEATKGGNEGSDDRHRRVPKGEETTRFYKRKKEIWICEINPRKIIRIIETEQTTKTESPP